MKDTIFYNQESTQYSKKRYPKVAQSYVQFFFTRRLDSTKTYVAGVCGSSDFKRTLLELGCADGVVMRELEREFPRAFEKLIGIDISPGMIAEANKKNTSTHAEFFLRSAYINRPPVDIITETGVINYSNFEEDMVFVYNNLKENGRYILSVAGTSSLRNRFKYENGFNDFRPYTEYETLLRERFEIVQVIGCGIFVPYLWRVPSLARIVQSIADTILGRLVPSWCHEKIYLLKKK